MKKITVTCALILAATLAVHAEEGSRAMGSRPDMVRPEARAMMGMMATSSRPLTAMADMMRGDIPMPVITTGDATTDARLKALNTEMIAKIKAITDEYQTKMKAIIGNKNVTVSAPIMQATPGAVRTMMAGREAEHDNAEQEVRQEKPAGEIPSQGGKIRSFFRSIFGN